MPRRPDPRVEDRILNAALTLFRQGGEKALTMRAVARAAGTNTPTVYRRFQNRRDILSALAGQIRHQLVKTLEATRTPREACIKYVEFATAHPYEFRLVCVSTLERSHANRSQRQSAVWTTVMVNSLGKMLAEESSGSQIDRKRLSLSLLALAHGTATLLLSHTLSRQGSRDLQVAFQAAVDYLLSTERNARP